MNQFDLKNRTALITGGAQGFGLDITKKFLNSGANVIILDIDEKELLKFGDKINYQNNIFYLKKLFLKDLSNKLLSFAK